MTVFEFLNFLQLKVERKRFLHFHEGLRRIEGVQSTFFHAADTAGMLVRAKEARRRKKEKDYFFARHAKIMTIIILNREPSRAGIMIS